MPNTSLADVIEFIVRTANLEDIDTIHQAARDRRTILGRVQASLTSSLLKPGDKVTLSGLSPKYLNGMTGTVVERKGGSGKPKFIVKLDDSAGRYVSDRPVGVPAQCLTKVEG
jgi:hypothetical protein